MKELTETTSSMASWFLFYCCCLYFYISSPFQYLSIRLIFWGKKYKQDTCNFFMLSQYIDIICNDNVIFHIYYYFEGMLECQSYVSYKSTTFLNFCEIWTMDHDFVGWASRWHREKSSIYNFSIQAGRSKTSKIALNMIKSKSSKDNKIMKR